MDVLTAGMSVHHVGVPRAGRPEECVEFLGIWSNKEL